MRIHVVEDERQLARHVAQALTRRGHTATSHFDGAEALKAAIAHPPDLIVLDLNLPGLEGLSVLAGLREASCPARVLILTARGEVEQRVKGLNAGADDYMAKPFSMDELVARIEALGRRGSTPTAADLLDVADLHMDVHHRRVHRAGRPIALPPRLTLRWWTSMWRSATSRRSAAVGVAPRRPSASMRATSSSMEKGFAM